MKSPTPEPSMSRSCNDGSVAMPSALPVPRVSSRNTLWLAIRWVDGAHDLKAAELVSGKPPRAAWPAGLEPLESPRRSRR